MAVAPCQILSKSIKWLQRYGDLTVFKMAVVCHLRFLKFKLLTAGAAKRPILHRHTKFRKYRSNFCGDIAIFVIFKMAAAAILDLLGTYWDHPRWLLDGLYRCAKLGWNRYSFGNYETFNILPLWLENAYSRSKNSFLGISPLEWWEQCQWSL